VALAGVAVEALAQEATTSTVVESDSAREQRLIAEFEAVGDNPADAVSFGSRDSDSSMIGKLLSSTLALAAICALAYVLLGKLLPRVMQISPAARMSMSASAPRGLIQVIDRLSLEPKRTLYLVKVGERTFLLAGTQNELTMLAPVDSVDGDEPEASEPGENVLGKFSSLLKSQTQKET